MADISKVKIPSVSTPYNIKDANAGYSISLVNKVLNLLNADNEIISSVTLPANCTAVEDGLVKTNGNEYYVKADKDGVKAGSYIPKIINILQGIKLVGRFIYIPEESILTYVDNISVTPLKKGGIYDLIPVQVTSISRELLNSIQGMHLNNANATKIIINSTRYGIKYINDTDYSNPNAFPDGETYYYNVCKNGTGYANGLLRHKFLSILEVKDPSGVTTSDTLTKTSNNSNVIFTPKSIAQAELQLYNDESKDYKHIYFIYDTSVMFMPPSNPTQVIINGAMNCKAYTYSVLDSNGAVLSTSTIKNFTSSIQIPLRAIASGEINMIKISLYAKTQTIGGTTPVTSNGDIHFFYTCPSGKTASIT